MRVSAETSYGVWVRMIYLLVDVTSEKQNNNTQQQQQQQQQQVTAKKIPVIHNQKPPGTRYVVYL